jgi:hypothetical protein
MLMLNASSSGVLRYVAQLAALSATVPLGAHREGYN